MTAIEKKEIYSNHFFSIFSDGSIGLSDGVGYLTTLSKHESKAVYDALCNIFSTQGQERSEIMTDKIGLFSNIVTGYIAPDVTTEEIEQLYNKCKLFFDEEYESSEIARLRGIIERAKNVERRDGHPTMTYTILSEAEEQ